MITTAKRTCFGEESIVSVDPIAHQELTSMTHFTLNTFKPQMQSETQACRCS